VDQDSPGREVTQFFTDFFRSQEYFSERHPSDFFSNGIPSRPEGRGILPVDSEKWPALLKKEDWGYSKENIESNQESW